MASAGGGVGCWGAGVGLEVGWVRRCCGQGQRDAGELQLNLQQGPPRRHARVREYIDASIVGATWPATQDATQLLSKLPSS